MDELQISRGRAQIPVPYPATQKKIKAEIMLGCPSAGCSGVGICKVMSHSQQTASKCPKASAWIGQSEDGRLRISFLKTSMDARQIKRHFGWRLFQIYEAYEIPQRLTRRIGLTPTTLQPGIYTVWESPRYLIVDF